MRGDSSEAGSRPAASGRRRYLFGTLALITLLVALFLPTGWYDRIPRSRTELPDPPIKGVTLVRLCFAVEGLIFLGFAYGVGVESRMRDDDRLELPPPMTSGAGDLAHPIPWVVAATALGAALRIYHITSDLWLDEITTVFDYLNVSPFHIIVAYTSSNNHLLNTLLVQGLIHTVGLREWAIRLPAVTLGIACVPAIYYLARTALGRRESVFAAFLLAVSYHHIFYSQNARGYSGLMLWGMLGTALFFRGLTSTRVRYWVLYAVVMFLAMATHLYSFFIIVGHGMACLAAGWMLRRQGRAVGPLAVRATMALAAVLLLSFHLYAAALPQVYVLMQGVYRDPAGGYAPLSLEYLQEILRGLSVGLGGVLGAVAAMIVGGIGFLTFCRRHALYALTLVLPLVATAAFVIAMNVIILPRSFMWGLPVAYIFAVAAITGLARAVAPKGERTARGWTAMAVAPAAVLSLLFVLSLASLPAYYRTPKQPNRESLSWVMAHKAPDDPLVPIFLAEWGVRFYGPSFGLRENDTFTPIRSVDALDAFERAHAGHTVWLLTTLERATHLTYPELERHIAARYERRETFPATIGGGDVSVWSSAPPRKVLGPLTQ